MVQRFSIFWITPQMTKDINGEIFSSGGATLYKNLSDQTVELACMIGLSLANER